MAYKQTWDGTNAAGEQIDPPEYAWETDDDPRNEYNPDEPALPREDKTPSIADDFPGWATP